MKYSEMTADQRKKVVDDPDSYPLRVSFLGKVALLTSGEVAFLLHHQVDFELDDRQVARILAE